MNLAMDGSGPVRVTGENVDVLRSVADDVFDGQLLPELVEAVMTSGGRLVVVAIREGLVVGQVQGEVQLHLDDRPQLYIDNLGVAAHARRLGIARALLAEIARWGSERGCEQAWIVTEPDNHAANELYLSIGALAASVTMYSFSAPLESDR